MSKDAADRAYMQAALSLARRTLGRAAPNPAVGCVIVAEGRVVGRGWTQPGGRPHAETEALQRAGAAARGATAYVTLEPCSHHGRTPPCTDAMIAAGIARVVVPHIDPDPRVNGAGFAKLRAAGIAVEIGLCEEEGREVNEGFLLAKKAARPMVTLKLASSLDGAIATAAGESKWITGELARRRAHLIRSQHDAVLVGSGTALADNPRLDVRLPGMEARAPLRVVLDGRGRVGEALDLVQRSVEQRTLIFTGEGANHPLAERPGLEVCGVQQTAEGLAPEAILAALAQRGVTRVMIEGGAKVAAAFLEADLVDNICWFRAPKVLGGDGQAAVSGWGLAHLMDAPRFARVRVERLEEDLLESLRRAR